MQWETTTILLDKLLESEDEAWQRLMDRFRPPLLGFARRYGLSDAECEDAAQDALVRFLEAYRDGRYDRTKGRLGTWLFTLMYQSIRSHKRDGARSPRQAPGRAQGANSDGRTTFFSALPDERIAREDWDEDWERHTVESCLSQLRSEVSPTHFRAFELTACREVPASEVARELGMSRDAVYQVRYRALKRLGELREGFESREGVGA